MGSADLLQLGGSEKLRTLIIDLLSKEWPLTSKQLHMRISKEKEITYQAVHKGIKQVVAEGILVQNEKGYEISAGWVANTKQRFENLEKSLKKKFSKPSNLTTELVFDNI